MLAAMPPPPTTPPDQGESHIRDRGDACPGALRLHPAADGGLARLRLPAGLLTGRQLWALSVAAERLGDGSLSITSRGNVELRGLADGCGPALAQLLRAAGLLPSETHERVRNIVASPLAGLDGHGGHGGHGGRSEHGGRDGQDGQDGRDRRDGRDENGRAESGGRGGRDGRDEQRGRDGRHEQRGRDENREQGGWGGRGGPDVRSWARELDALLCASERAAGLSGRFLFALDDGRCDVAGLGADVTLLAARGGRGDGPGDGRVELRIGRHAFRVPAADAARAALAAAEAFLAAADEAGTGAWRVRELPEGQDIAVGAELERAGVAAAPHHPAPGADRSAPEPGSGPAAPGPPRGGGRR
ncbi:hypothetical protein AB0J25_29480, partial [Streptomyces sp. NPDC049910]